MLNGFGGNWRRRKNLLQAPNYFGVECYNVNARLSGLAEAFKQVEPPMPAAVVAAPASAGFR